MNAAIHSHAASRAVEMRGVSSQPDAPRTVGGGNALVYSVRAHFQHGIGLGAWHDGLQSRLDGFWREGVFNWPVFVGVDRNTPSPRHLEQAEVARAHLPAVGHVRQSGQVIFKSKSGGGKDCGFRVCLAFEGHAQSLAYQASRAIRADQPAAAQRFAAVAMRQFQPYTVGILCGIGHSSAKTHLSMRVVGQLGQQRTRQLVLFALQTIGMSCHIGQHRQIKASAFTQWVQANLPLRADKPLLQQDLGDAKGVQHIQCGGMERRGSQVVFNTAGGFNHLHRHTSIGQSEGGRKTNRACTGHKHLMRICHEK